MILLLTDLNDRLRVNGAAARAALGVKELEQFLKSRGVRGVAKKRAFAFDKHQIFGLQLFEMITSTELSGSGMCSISPLRNSTFSMPDLR